MKDIEGLKKRKLYDISLNGTNLAVYQVDGKMVKKAGHMDFVEGGHDLVYKFIPANEIWIDDLVDPDERDFVVIHEASEWLLMKYGKKKYDPAHVIANKIELRFRRGNPRKPRKILKAVSMSKSR